MGSSAVSVSLVITRAQRECQGWVCRASDCPRTAKAASPVRTSVTASSPSATPLDASTRVAITRAHPGNYVNFGVREFAMSAIANGIVLSGGYIPYVGTFLTFSDYARNALRMAAIGLLVGLPLGALVGDVAAVDVDLDVRPRGARGEPGRNKAAERQSQGLEPHGEVPIRHW